MAVSWAVEEGIVNLGQWLGLLSLILSGYVLWQIRQFLLLAFTAIVFACALNRFANCLRRRWRLSRSLAVAIACGVVLLSVLLFFSSIVPPFIEQFQKLLQLLPDLWEKFRLLHQSLNQRQAHWNWLPPLPDQKELLSQLQRFSPSLFQSVLTVFSNSFNVLGQLILIGILTFLLAIAPRRYRQATLKLVPSFYRRRADCILALAEESLSNWLVGILFNCLFIGVLSGLGLWILQVKLVLVHALIAGVFNFIPNIGPAASMIFPILVAIDDAPWKIGAIVLWYFIIQNIEAYWLTPTVMAKQVSLLPAVTLMAQLFFASLFGLWGLLLALPLTVVAKIGVEEILFKDILDRWQVREEGSQSPQERSC
jgi:predicted PurR-regulated permease PerM